MVRKVVDEPFDGFDPYPVGVIECPPIDVELSQREPLDHDFIGLSIDASRAIVVHRSGIHLPPAESQERTGPHRRASARAESYRERFSPIPHH
jgi:hypothetical protein